STSAAAAADRSICFVECGRAGLRGMARLVVVFNRGGAYRFAERPGLGTMASRRIPFGVAAGAVILAGSIRVAGFVGRPAGTGSDSGGLSIAGRGLKLPGTIFRASPNTISICFSGSLANWL